MADAQKNSVSQKWLKWVLFLWLIFVAKLLTNITDLPYLQPTNDTTDHYYEYLYFSFYSIIAWHTFQFNNLFRIYGEPTSFWTRLESQFIRLQSSSTTGTVMQESMDITNDVSNVYATNKTSPSAAHLKAVEIDASSTNFSYSYSDLYTLSHAFSVPVILRKFLPITYDSDNLLLRLLHKHGNSTVPVMWNKNQTSIRFLHNKVSHDYSQFDGHTLDDIFLNKEIADHQSFDMVKFWHICDKNNNSDLWEYFNLHLLQIPPSHFAAAGLFMSNLPKSKDAGNTKQDRWYLSADMHSDVGPSFFAQLRGRKLWRLIDLKYTHLMRPIWYGTYGRSLAYNAAYFDSIPRYEMILNAGDVIFFPPWIWHEAYIDHDAGFEISCGIKLFREPNMLASLQKSSLFTLNTLGSVARAALFGSGRSKLC